MTQLRVSTYDYDTTRALFDGTVPLGDLAAAAGRDTVDLRSAATLPEIFERLLTGEADVAELGLTFLLRALDAGAELAAIPVFPNRVFRHSCVFVNPRSGIRRPEDLTDRTIGEFGVYGQDSGVWAKGVLADEHGFDPLANRWVIGGLEAPAPRFGFTTHPHPEGLDIGYRDDASLSDLLVAGEIDALFTANVPQPFLDGSPDVVRLFPDYEPVERDWYRRTRLFPMMHTIAVPRALLAERPALAQAVHDTYLAAKEHAAEGYRQARRLYQVRTMLPWASALTDRNDAELPHDWWPYGVSANRPELETYLRYHHEHGLSAHRRTVEELFVLPGT